MCGWLNMLSLKKVSYGFVLMCYGNYSNDFSCTLSQSWRCNAFPSLKSLLSTLSQSIKSLPCTGAWQMKVRSWGSSSMVLWWASCLSRIPSWSANTKLIQARQPGSEPTCGASFILGEGGNLFLFIYLFLFLFFFFIFTCDAGRPI